MADLGLAEELGEQLAIAIRVDRLFRRHSEVTEALQASLLPRSLPDVPGTELAAVYVAATSGLEVGGDFYDAYRVPGGWGLAIGDVCGKGEEAAVVTAAARHAIRVLAHDCPDPAEVLRKANAMMLADEFGGRFLTAKIAYPQWRDSSLHIALGSSGHPGPAIVRADGRVEMLGEGGLPLGLFPDAEPGIGELDLAEGDVLFFFTDGVTEARDAAGRYFEDRLTDELAGLAGRSAAEMVAAVRDRVTSFSGNQLRDDMTILALRAGAPPG
jgi:serine phosphatase RsbU (regulator of sigma subunit)